MHRLFVYGTLLTGQHNHHFLENSKRIEITHLYGFRMVSLGGFPAIYKAGTYDTVLGEIYEINDEILGRLDYLEGHPNFYTRVEVESNIGTVWVYVNNNENIKSSPVIENGDWIDYVQKGRK